MAEKKGKSKQKNVKKRQDTPLKQLKPHHMRAIELMVEGELTDKGIARVMEVAPETLSRWKRSEVFMEELDRQLKEVDRYRRLRYRAKANYAADVLVELMFSAPPRVALEAVKEVLRLAGDGEVQQEQGSGGGVILLPPQVKP